MNSNQLFGWQVLQVLTQDDIAHELTVVTRIVEDNWRGLD